MAHDTTAQSTHISAELKSPHTKTQFTSYAEEPTVATSTQHEQRFINHRKCSKLNNLKVCGVNRLLEIAVPFLQC